MNSRELVAICKILDETLRRCLRQCEGLPHALQEIYSNQPPNAEIDRDMTHRRLEETVRTIYEVMIEAMFRVAPTLCPSLGVRPLNLYFWPAYHSLISHERVDYVNAGGRTGVGISGVPSDVRTWEHYSRCCHSEWHAVLFRDLDLSAEDRLVAAPSIDAWLVAQKPRVSADPYDVVHSLRIGPNAAVDQDDDPQSRVVTLTEDSREWGAQLSDGLNALLSMSERPDWRFPDRKDKSERDETEWRDARHSLYSLWLHSCFCDRTPPWLPVMCGRLSQAGLGQMAAAVTKAASDQWSGDWGDRSQSRPRLSNATVICLHRLNAHAVVTKGEPLNEASKAGSISDDRSLGTACMMSSIALDTSFIEFIRPWMRSIFAMIRNAELTVFADKLVQRESARARLAATGFVIHELNAVFSKQFSNMRAQMANADEASVRTRRFAWDILGSLVNLAFLQSKLAVLDDPEKRRELRHAFLNPLRELNGRGVLEPAIASVAAQVYNDSEAAGMIRFPDLDGVAKVDLSTQQFARCLLLVAEPIRNCRQHAADGTGSASWRAFVQSGVLTIVLQQPGREHLPSSRTFEFLGSFLRDVGIGDAPAPRWVAKKKEQLMEWIVTVRLDEWKEGASDESSKPSPSEH